MEFTTEQQSDKTILKASGRMDATTSSEFEKKCTELINKGSLHIIVDLSGLEYISSAGLRSILAVGKKLKADGGSFAFCNLRGMVKEVFDISGFGSLFPIHDTLESALA
ncbi:MAG: STAS domain-containing protein [Desulfonatronovibrionaceae bacterium]